MLCVSLGGRVRNCAPVSGGISDLLVADSADFDWTSGAVDGNGDPTGYSGVALHSGAVASDTIGSISIGSGGTGYTSVPTVTFTGGGGSGAAGTAVLTGTAVTSITITNPGSGYTSAPTIGFTGGGGSGATATAGLASGGAYFFPITSIDDFLGVDITQSNADGSASSYAYVIAARLAQIDQSVANFTSKLDAAALCCQMTFVWRDNNGKVFVVGEKYVDDDIITRFKFRQDGTKASTGKKFTDFNGTDLSLQGSYSRMPYEFTGGWSAISDFIKP